MEEKQDDSSLPVIIAKRLKPPPSARMKKKAPEEGKKGSFIKIFPVKEIVLFPHHVMPITIVKGWSFEGIEKVARSGSPVGILAYKQGAEDTADDEKASLQFCEVGTEAKILKIIRFPDNSHGALVQGIKRFRLAGPVQTEEDGFSAEISHFAEARIEDKLDLEVVALGKAMKQLVHKAINLSPNIPSEATFFVDHVQDPLYLADLVVPYLSIEFADKQALLEIEELAPRLKKIHHFLSREIEVLEITQKINSDVKSEFGKQQRKYLVREQMRLLQKELGEIDGKPAGSSSLGQDPQDLNERIAQSKMPKEAREAALHEVERMGLMQSGAPEYMVSHTYVSWLLDLPWDTYAQGDVNLNKAQDILDNDHYGLKKVKKRILEHLAVYALKKTLKGPILLFVGPPGVGKTSLGKSVAKALGRPFVRIALGGVRDEAEIRGHRRTYIGSMPGKIVDVMKKAKSMDPVILLDEIDKLAADGRGDPSSALLEVLDPEQNHTFTDHYLNVPLDLSKVFFIATANSLHTIPAPLRDRMEIIELNSYTLSEKSHIAFEYLLPQVVEEHGLDNVMNLDFDQATMKSLIENYTREAGVRQLKRELAGIVRGFVHDYVRQTEARPPPANKRKTTKKVRRQVKLEDIRKYLGPEAYLNRKRPQNLPAGVSTGLAWTPHGGDVLYIETAQTGVAGTGTGKFTVTGQLGDVMKESVQTAFSFILAHAKRFGIDRTEMGKVDLHIHFPEGAVKKDGPSAGTASFCALVSQFTGFKIPSHVAMTGEISLRGDVLPVGGIKEKLLAAHRYGIKTVLIPRENKRDLEDIPADVQKELEIVCVSTLNDVYKTVFYKP